MEKFDFESAKYECLGKNEMKNIKGGEGDLSNAAAFVNNHGMSYSLSLGTGEHVDVISVFQIMNLNFSISLLV
jgi:hypothetical protein